MRAVLSAVMLCLSLILAPAPPAAARDWIDGAFDPAPMSREDIATLQAALAFSGDYYGFTDGVWNTDAQAALEAWVRREVGNVQPTYRHLDALIMNLENERVANGWQLFYSDTTNTSYLHPFDLLKEVDNPDAVEFLSDDTGFSLMVRFTDQAGMQDVHDWFYGKAIAGSEPYRYNDNQLWITSVSIDEGMTAYARSDFTNGDWSTISIVVWPQYFNHLNLMAASMTVGGSPASLVVPAAPAREARAVPAAQAAPAAAVSADPPPRLPTWALCPSRQVRRSRPVALARAASAATATWRATAPMGPAGTSLRTEGDLIPFSALRARRGGREWARRRRQRGCG